MVLLTLKDRGPECKNPSLERSVGKGVNAFLLVCLGQVEVQTSVSGWTALSIASPKRRRGERRI